MYVQIIFFFEIIEIQMCFKLGGILGAYNAKSGNFLPWKMQKIIILMHLKTKDSLWTDRYTVKFSSFRTRLTKRFDRILPAVLSIP